MSLAAYNATDPTQEAFLSALAQGETGGASGAYSEGYGGVNLANASTDQYGFPQWGGAATTAGPTHAAGAFQFQPSTWDTIAATYGLNFQNPGDQNAGAWYLAEQTYEQQTGGDLETALSSGNTISVQAALSSVWPSVLGNGNGQGSLSADLASGTGASLVNTSSPTSGSATSPTSNTSTTPGGIIGAIENFFVRFGLIIIGSLIILVALWMILSDNGLVPSPGQVAKGATTLLAEA